MPAAGAASSTLRCVSRATMASSCLRPRIDLRAAIRCHLSPLVAGDCRHRHLIAFRDDQQKSLASLRDRSDECDRHGKPWEREQLHEGVYDRRAEQHHGVRHPRGSHRHDYHPFDSFSSLKDLGELAAGWPAERLAAIWNSLPGAKPVKSFKTAKVAASRIWSSIQGLGEDAKPAAKPQKPKPDKKPGERIERDEPLFEISTDKVDTEIPS